jgi:hypothetical protein
MGLGTSSVQHFASERHVEDNRSRSRMAMQDVEHPLGKSVLHAVAELEKIKCALDVILAIIEPIIMLKRFKEEKASVRFWKNSKIWTARETITRWFWVFYFSRFRGLFCRVCVFRGL